MPKTSQPTNQDLMALIKMQHQDTTQRLSAIEQQVKKTNGRVTRLEKWKDRLDIIEVYKKENGTVLIPKEVDWQKLMLYALGLVGTALAIISYMAQQ